MRNKIIKITLFLMLLYIFWGWFFSKTIYGKPLYVYLSFLSLFVLFFFSLINTRSIGKIPRIIIIWFPFSIWMAGSYLVFGSIEHFIYWFIVICILMISNNKSFLSKIHYRQIVCFGIIGLCGIAIQVFVPSFYNVYFDGIWLHDNVDMWLDTGYGFNGFTYQLDTTAFLLIYAEAVLLFLDSFIGYNKSIFKRILFVLLLIGIALTGKRAIILISWISPIIVYYVRSGRFIGKFRIALFVVCISFLMIYLITPFLGIIDELPGIGRVSSLFDSFNTVDDMSSGRSGLWIIAMRLFEQSPLFGIGVGHYVYESGTGTNAHNTYLELLCETGIWGFTLFVVPMIITLNHTVKLVDKSQGELKNYYSFSLFVQLFMIMYSLSGNTFVNMPGYMMYFISIGLMNNLSMKRAYEYKKIHIQ